MSTSSSPLPTKQEKQPSSIEKQIDRKEEFVKKEFKVFLNSTLNNVAIYEEQIKQFKQFNNSTLFVDCVHLFNFNSNLFDLLINDFYRFLPSLNSILSLQVSLSTPQGYVGEDQIQKDYSVAFYNLQSITLLRHINSSHLGKLTCIKATITRTSEVRPELLIGSFICPDCNQSIPNIEQQFKYTEPTTCPNTLCNNRQSFILDPTSSKFVDWQKLRVQESTSEVPSGAMPRSLDVILRNEMVERAKAGDKVLITGVPIVVPDVGQLFGVNAESRREIYGRGKDGFGSDGVTGLKALGVRDLTYRIAFLGLFVKPEVEKDSLSAIHDLDGKLDPKDILDSFTTEELDAFNSMRSDLDLNQKLLSAVCPHIFGHEDIKKGLLLQCLGGVHKVTKEGINLRGDINVCIVGDPSTAKSQFLKYISSFMPRAVYTSGKASTAAGLTASVMKDEETGEFTIEAGALMLADNGICCIDEFDKMNLVDQVAIHEAMEQQTISITKAGIQATLNARASILAAANPVRGRYDKKLSLRVY